MLADAITLMSSPSRARGATSVGASRECDPQHDGALAPA